MEVGKKRKVILKKKKQKKGKLEKKWKKTWKKREMHFGLLS